MQESNASIQSLKKKLYSKQQTSQLSQHQKFPQIFKWKTASLVLASISAIFLVILIVVIYQIGTEPEFSTNLTFLTSIVAETQIIRTKEELLNLVTNFQEIYGQTKFQRATKLGQSISVLTQKNIQQIFLEADHSLLFIFQLISEQKQLSEIHHPKFAIFMNSPFPIPSDDEFNYSTTYYSFEINDQRKSSIISLRNNKTLKMAPKSDKITSPSQCRTYNFTTNQKNGEKFEFLNSVIDFSLSSESVSFHTGHEKGLCFSSQYQNKTFNQQLKQIIAFENYHLNLELMEVYHLE